MNHSRPEREARWRLIEQLVDSTTDALGKPIDPGVRPVVVGLLASGIETTNSCDGDAAHHGERTSRAPFVDVGWMIQLGDRLERAQAREDAYRDQHRRARTRAARALITRAHRRDERRENERQRLHALRLRERLADLLREFYLDGRFTDTRLIITDFGWGGSHLTSYCAVATPLRTRQRIRARYAELRHEMDAFARFLHHRFLSAGCAHPLRLNCARIQRAWARQQRTSTPS